MDNSTPDPAEHDPFARSINYDVDETSFGWINLTIRGLTPAETRAVLKAARTATKLPIDPHGAYFVATHPRGGQPPGPTHDPAFLTTVVEHAWDYRDKNGVVPSAAVLVEKLGVGRTPYFEWLKASGLTSTDVKLAASKRTIPDGVFFLSALQQERRKERSSDRE